MRAGAGQVRAKRQALRSIIGFLMYRYSVSLALVLLLAPPARGQEAGKDRLTDSVDRALAFLHKIQEADGAWRAGNEKNPAVTALAVMAFLSAGHVPGEGPYSDAVERGIRWVLARQQPNG